ncbi:MAG TPA: sulfotransferase [Caulobacteraceae bacterium]
MAQAPLQVFIMGAPRSGTSVSYFAIREVFGLPGMGESHVMEVFYRIVRDFNAHANFFKFSSGNLAILLDPEHFTDYMVSYIRYFYELHFPYSEWVDKTPNGASILASDLILKAFPHARIILTKRNGIEVVQSHRRKFATSFETACLIWLDCMEAYEKTVSAHPTILVLDQSMIANEPDKAGILISAYLGRPEKSAALASFFASNQTDRSSTHDWRRPLSQSDAGWSRDEARTFERICGAMMDRLGYSVL